ncbi:hypothetical protein CRYUN_Cryun06bG0142300 [Craigia yunnanensis]
MLDQDLIQYYNHVDPGRIFAFWFGRFENEPLAWERRSSFSHNRYLEEVKKCSKPGSVIEKKAYFEAHFRKKAPLLQGSSEDQNGGEVQSCESNAVENDGYREYQTGENDAAENEGYGDESDSISKSSHYNHFDGNGLDDVDNGEDFCCGNEGIDHENEWNQSDHANEGSICARFDKSPEDSEYLNEGALIECGREYPGVISAHETHVLVPGDVKPEETHQSEIGCDEPLINNNKPEKEVEENLDDDTVYIEVSFKSRDPSPNNGTTREVGTTNLEIWQKHSPKLNPATENKATKPRLKSLVSPDHSQKNIACDSSKVAARIQVRREKEITRRTKAEKLPLQTATPTRRSMLRSPKEETSCSIWISFPCIKRPMTKKVIEVQPSSSKKIEPVPHQTPHRLKQTVSSTKTDVKSGARAFHFKSGEREERRKELYMKLEEKMHVKEAGMNQIQARTRRKLKLSNCGKALISKQNPCLLSIMLPRHQCLLETSYDWRKKFIIRCQHRWSFGKSFCATKWI